MSFLISQYSSVRVTKRGAVREAREARAAISGGAALEETNSLRKPRIKLNRNNTSFPVQLLELFKSTEFTDEYSYLKYYQNIVRFYVSEVDVNAKGLLVNFTMGMGKSIMAVAVAIELMESGYEPLMLMSKSLQGNMRGAIIKYARLRAEVDKGWAPGQLADHELNAWIATKFTFVSLNASNMLEQMSKATLNVPKFDKLLEKQLAALGEMKLAGKVLIIDEAHNLFRSIINGGRNALGLYDNIMKTKDMRLVFLTGTPINNSPFELVPCYNMLAGDTVLPESWNEFNRFFVNQETGLIKNCGKFQNRILGLTSYVSHMSDVGAAVSGTRSIGASTVEFPEEKPLIIERVKILDDDWGTYQIAREKEKEEENRPSKSKGGESRLRKPSSGGSSSFRVQSRQFSNFVPPLISLDSGMLGGARISDPTMVPDEMVRSAKLGRIYENLLRHDNQLGIIYSQFTGIGGLGILGRYLELRGWEPYVLAPTVVGGLIDMWRSRGGGGGGGDNDLVIELANAKHLKLHPAAALEFGSDIIGLDGYKVTNTRRRNDPINSSLGITIYARDVRGAYRNVYQNGVSGGAVVKIAAKPKKFAFITGKVLPEDRDRIQVIFNSDANKRGGIIDLLLISSTGAEGLDLKNVRHVHITEPYWNYARISQTIARAARNASHVALPAEERDVQPYIYLAVKPDSSDSKELTTDEELYNRAIINRNSVETFTAAVHGTSIECALNRGPKCRMCNPNDVPLFTSNILFDVERANDPCHILVEKKIDVIPVMIGDKKYYYTDAPLEAFGIIAYEYNEKLKTYTRMSPASDVFRAIVDALGKDTLEIPLISE